MTTKETKTMTEATVDQPTVELSLKDVVVTQEDNSRNKITGASVKDLAEDIKEGGLLQYPAVQLREDGKYHLVLGFRRMAALKLLGWEKCTFKVFPGSDRKEALLANWAENEHRKDLTPPEQALCLHTLVKKEGIKASLLQERSGRSKVHINNLVRLREKLSEECWSLFAKGRKQGEGDESYLVWDVSHWLKVAAKRQEDQLAYHKALLEKAKLESKGDKGKDKGKGKGKGEESEGEDESEEGTGPSEEDAKLESFAQWVKWADKQSKNPNASPSESIDVAYLDGAKAMLAAFAYGTEGALKGYPRPVKG